MENPNKINRHLVTRAEALERGYVVDSIILTDKNAYDIVGADCLYCGCFNMAHIDEEHDCDRKECHHFAPVV